MRPVEGRPCFVSLLLVFLVGCDVVAVGVAEPDNDDICRIRVERPRHGLPHSPPGHCRELSGDADQREVSEERDLGRHNPRLPVKGLVKLKQRKVERRRSQAGNTQHVLHVRSLGVWVWARDI